jgi:hypothetical protein
MLSNNAKAVDREMNNSLTFIGYASHHYAGTLANPVACM